MKYVLWLDSSNRQQGTISSTSCCFTTYLRHSPSTTRPVLLIFFTIVVRLGNLLSAPLMNSFFSFRHNSNEIAGHAVYKQLFRFTRIKSLQTFSLQPPHISPQKIPFSVSEHSLHFTNSTSTLSMSFIATTSCINFTWIFSTSILAAFSLNASWKFQLFSHCHY